MVKTIVKCANTELGLLVKSTHPLAKHHEVNAVTVTRAGDRVSLDVDGGKQQVTVYLSQKTALWLAVSLLGEIGIPEVEPALANETSDLTKVLKFLTKLRAKAVLGVEKEA